MKNQHLLFPFLLFLFAFHVAAFAQNDVEVIAPEVGVNVGENVTLDLKVVYFENIISSQFSINYDPTIVEFVSVGNFGFDNMNEDNFGTPGEGDIVAGELTYQWIANDIIQGESLPDSTILFSVTFKGIGTNQQVSPVAFTNDPTPIEFGASPGGAIPNALTDGSITVIGPTAVREIITPDFVFHPITPNPIKEKAQVRFDLAYRSQTILSIYNLAGRAIYQSDNFYELGENTVLLPRSIFPAAGTYLVQLSVGNSHGVQKVLVID